MPIEVIYEISVDSGGVGYPVMSQVYKDGNIELGRSLVSFSDLPPSVGSSYLTAFKAYLVDLISTIPELDSLTYEDTNKFTKLAFAISYLEYYVPAHINLESEQTTE
jgi:hypothetical protein